MPRVTIYQFQPYNFQTDEIVRSRRWGTGTEEAIRGLRVTTFSKTPGLMWMRPSSVSWRYLARRCVHMLKNLKS